MSALPHAAAPADETIRYAISRSWLGHTLLAQSHRGLCALLLGDDSESLAADLRRRFPRSPLAGGDTDCLQKIPMVIGSPHALGTTAGVPLDLSGTAFQQRVWNALMEIQKGSTESYSGIARRIGAPLAARAVAQACGANPAAVLVPCHRVVGRDGALTGYRWGVDRKRALLEREAALAGSTASH